MALWNLNGEIVYSDGALSLPNPKSGSWASRHSYTVPYTNIGKGGFIEKEDKKYHVPSWIEVLGFHHFVICWFGLFFSDLCT